MKNPLLFLFTKTRC